MKVAVTGGAGFIGSHIVELLTAEGHEPVVIDNFSTGRRANVPSGVRLHEIDVSSSGLEDVFRRERFDSVIHQAAQVKVPESIRNPYADARSNILGSVNVLACCRTFAVKKLVYASSCAVYGDPGDVSIEESVSVHPLSFYGLSKNVPEHYMKLFGELCGLSYTILRYANVYGPRQSSGGEGGVVSIFAERLIGGEAPAIYGTGNQVRDFVYVKDVAKANVLALADTGSHVLNIGRNERTSINELFALMASLNGTPVVPRYLPPREGDIEFSRLDNTAARRVLGWKPAYDLEDGLKETLDYFRSRISP
ncbi:NAD-dependent epimerase/dehydratase family protein [Paenibacillus humicola]|uniref:NAD-dependent epimerase/dehydratase family protein n=1 Tax=Paenibacillus humicola TaxID=3110540 RepID=UPI00237BC119|nr:NAD-dependent epimerase/dehydratase family protein [Paenibacillus humicola]